MPDNGLGRAVAQHSAGDPREVAVYGEARLDRHGSCSVTAFDRCQISVYGDCQVAAYDDCQITVFPAVTSGSTERPL
jgi:hypothetical protein